MASVPSLKKKYSDVSKVGLESSHTPYLEQEVSFRTLPSSTLSNLPSSTPSQIAVHANELSPPQQPSLDFVFDKVSETHVTADINQIRTMGTSQQGSNRVDNAHSGSDWANNSDQCYSIYRRAYFCHCDAIFPPLYVAFVALLASFSLSNLTLLLASLFTFVLGVRVLVMGLGGQTFRGVLLSRLPGVYLISIQVCVLYTYIS